MANPKGSKSREAAVKKSGSTKNKNNTKGGLQSSGKQIKENFIFGDEAIILVTISVSILLFLSNIGLCGVVGRILQSAQFGLFGSLGFFFPFVLIGVVFFLLFKTDDKDRIRRLSAFLFLLLFLSSILQLIFDGVEGKGPLDFYQKAGQGAIGGGLIGGSIASILYSIAGQEGAILILTALALFCLVLITEKPIMRMFAIGSMRAAGKAKDKAKEDIVQLSRSAKEKRNEIRERRAKKTKIKGTSEKARIEPLRAEKKVRGVDFAAIDLSPKTEVEQLPVDEEIEDLEEALEIEEEFKSELKLSALPVIDLPLNNTHRDARLSEEEFNLRQSLIYSNPNLVSFKTETVVMDDDYETEDVKEDNKDNKFSKLIEDNEDSKFSEFEDNKDSELIKAYEDSGYSELEENNEDSGYSDFEDIDYTDYSKEKGAGEKEKKFETSKTGENVTGGGDPELIEIEENADEGRDSKLDNGEDDFDADDSREDDLEFSDTESVIKEINENNENDTEIIDVHVEDDNEYESEDINDSAPVFGIKSISKTGHLSRVLSSGNSANTSHSAGNQINQLLGYEREPKKPAISGPSPEEEAEISEEIDKNKREKKPYKRPPLSLLSTGGIQDTDSRNEIQENAGILIETLKSFGIGAKIINISVGPSVTRYEIKPEQGIKLSKIVSLTDDIKMSLAAADIRMEAPIPGKSAVGIEVPNKKSQIVYLGDIIGSKEFQTNQTRIAFGVGKDIAGKIVITDISKMPHLLIAGSTGSGKSVSINTLIMSVIYKYGPDEVRMIMVDPKVVELQVYNGIPHLLNPVVTDPKKAAAALNWCVKEMMDRYDKFAKAGVRDLKGYNKRIKNLREHPACPEDLEREELPQILIIIDELADLMMVSASEVEEAICRIAQLARACGMHLVIATQRPSVNVITGLIKANIPSRIAFAVTSGIDSRTILDMVGAEKLLGKGDMLFYPQGIPKPVRVQGAFVSDEEVQAVTEFLKETGETDYMEDVTKVMEQPSVSNTEDTEDEGAYDPLFSDAAKLIIESDRASIGLIQRKFRVGFNRAARIMDQLADEGVVGGDEGTKARKILMTLDEFYEAFP